MNGKPTQASSTAQKWAPIAVAALVGGIVVGQAGQRIGLVAAMAVAVLVGLAAGAAVYGVLRLMRDRR